MIYSFCRGALRLIYKLLFRLEAHGLEHIPAEGGVLLCSNHLSNLDPPTIGILLQRKVHFMAKKELFDIFGLGWLIKQLGAFPVKRGGVSKESIKTALTLLREGHVMGIFPEGTRNKGEDASIGKRGAATFALRSDAAVIPVAIIGNYKLFRKMKVVYGPPVDLSAFKEDKGADAAEMATEAIMARIAELKSRG
ncbi:1-acyl-sn-glycerol-3-phosphate acyltransferase [Paenibacillus faecis]|uniref:1-acyl-sn-glycerol-3-phosphate acyltransferase n=1 Tax=Paenibacillus faecis TaxID=862114 RepID=A0A5D0CTU9_9BACL|nr:MULTISPECIES: lysophospholipid acyltransferase family protein [Paenibacillus]MCA1294715.1 1-acyl-sn-glycerol-3-phosphate acyltransferase [Paenibacillus sp. alder61]TYA13292.1 1-acyl-sn-glycerol-3-phosphate acyltransferase [Paenibacillus faecis]GIO83569.1 1-acyl-sn-glycerol-3-phosphate acyltransferase [Paenibacillus faecis]